MISQTEKLKFIGIIKKCITNSDSNHMQNSVTAIAYHFNHPVCHTYWQQYRTNFVMSSGILCYICDRKQKARRKVAFRIRGLCELSEQFVNSTVYFCLRQRVNIVILGIDTMILRWPLVY
jgi:hypothetical protein